MLFGYVSYNWRKLMMFWEDIESKIPQFRSHEKRKELRFTIKTVTFIVMGCALREYFNIHIFKILNIKYGYKDCK